MQMNVLFVILLVSVMMLGACASTPKRSVTPYTYPYWAMPHGDEIIPARPIETEPIPLPVVPTLPDLH